MSLQLFSSGTHILPETRETMFQVSTARLKTDVNAAVGRKPSRLKILPAFSASAIPASDKPTSVQPVNRFSRFHSLWPCLKSISLDIRLSTA